MIGFASLGLFIQFFSNFEFHPISFTLIGMLVFGYALTPDGFKYESSKSKLELQKLFLAFIIDE